MAQMPACTLSSQAKLYLVENGSAGLRANSSKRGKWVPKAEDWTPRECVIEGIGNVPRGRIVNQEKVKWGVLGVAGIAVRKVITAMQKGEWSAVTAIASRDLAKAEEAAHKRGISKAYGSYEELLADPEIEAIYN